MEEIQKKKGGKKRLRENLRLKSRKHKKSQTKSSVRGKGEKERVRIRKRLSKGRHKQDCQSKDAGKQKDG